MAPKRKASLEGLIAGLTDAVNEANTVSQNAPEASPVKTTAARPHVSLYLDPRVQVEIKRIALDHGNRKVHDLYLEAVDMLLKHYRGKTIRDITLG